MANRYRNIFSRLVLYLFFLYIVAIFITLCGDYTSHVSDAVNTLQDVDVSYACDIKWTTTDGLAHLTLLPHIWVNDWISIGSENGLSPIPRQAII